MLGETENRAYRTLRRAAAAIFAGGLLGLWAAAYLFAGHAGPAHAVRWAALASAAWAYFCYLLRRNLSKNRDPHGELFPDLGPANAITIARAWLMAAFTGLLVLPPRTGPAAWVPGALYIAAALPDFVDGIVARRTGRTTRLGELLDMDVDSIGVFAASTLAVLYGTVPVWYLPIGLARYLFVFGLRLRERLGLPVFDLPPSLRRRGFAALKMGFMFAVLFPVFRPPGTHLGVAAFGLPFAAGFLWDWGLATGRIRPGTAGPETPAVRVFLDWFPPILRIATVLLAPVVIGAHLADPGARALGFVEIGAVLAITLGVAVHSAAILAVLLLGLAQNWVPLGVAGSLLLVVYIGLITLGGGRLSLWPIERRLITHRIGDPG